MVMVMVILLLVAVVGLAQEAFDVITQLTICPFVKVVVVYVALLVPTLLPFTFHWYDGVVPPLLGVAVKVTEAPDALGLVPEVIAMLTAGVTAVLKLMVMLLLVAVVVLAQAKFDVKTHVTTWPAVKVEVV